MTLEFLSLLLLTDDIWNVMVGPRGSRHILYDIR